MLPLSFVVTLIAMSMLGFSLDNLALLALTLAIGFLVDDAVVFLENTVRRMHQYGETAPVASLRGAKEISFTILSMSLSLAAVFIPPVCMPGLIGRIFREFSITIMIAILASGLISLTVTPMMCARMLAAMPIALGLGADASSRIPLGLSIVGGLVLSQLLTLDVTPVTFLLMESVQVNVLDKSAFFSRRDVLAEADNAETKDEA